MRIGWVIAAFVVLAAVYGWVNPIFEAPDELQHFYYVRHIAQTGTLAVQDPRQVALYRQEGSQPPLYYLLGAALTSWIDTRDADQQVRENPHVALGVPQAFANKNAVIHTEAERFPFQGVPLAVHLLRLLSTALGALTVWATYLLGREVFPKRPRLALLAATFNAFLPQFLFLSAAVSNDVIVAATVAWTMIVLARGLRLGFDWRRAILLGVLLGLAALSKLGGLSAALLVLAGLAWWWRRRTATAHGSAEQEAPRIQRRPSAAQVFAVVAAVAAIVGGWWYARNVVLYGDPFGLRTMLDVVGRREEFGPSDFLFEMEGLRLSFWGLFGWFNVLMARWMYAFYDILAVIGVGGWLVWGWRGIRARRTGGQGAEKIGQTELLLGLLLWLLIVGLALVRWTWSATGSQGRLLFAALPAICLLWAGGLGAWMPRRYERAIVTGLAAVWLILAASVPFLYIAPAYAHAPRLSMDALPASLNRLDVTFGDKIKLLGYEMPEQRVRRGTPLPVTLYWQALAPVERDYTAFVHLFGRADQPIGQEDTYPGGGNDPTSQWKPGEVLRDQHEVLAVPEARAPGAGTVDVGLYDFETKQRLPAFDRDGHPLERVMLSPFKLTTWAAPQYKIESPVRFGVGPDIELVGYRLGEGAQPGQPLKIALYWRARAAPPEDYTVFVHLVNTAGELVAQHDGQPVGGDYPTSFWDAGETVKDEHEIELPAGLAPGEYRVQVGLYRPADGARLRVTDTESRDIGDSAPIQSVIVAEKH